MVISRKDYVEQIYAKSWNGKVKIITGLRRSGKSYLQREVREMKQLVEGRWKTTWPYFKFSNFNINSENKISVFYFNLEK